tara:strand:- start:950 stop:1489 length:540 start_codon:yes stop_codon:yes gene_type:complete
MSFLTDNKQQLIHVASEVVLFAGVVYYFDKKHKSTLNIMEQLAEKINEQNNTISSHELKIQELSDVISQLSDRINNIKIPPPVMIPSPPQPMMQQQQPMMQQQPPPQPMTQPKKVIPVKPQIPKKSKKSVVTFKTPPPPPIEEESDLDAELCEELEELEDQESADESILLEEGLKKSLP